MELVNETPFSILPFEGSSPSDDRLFVVAVRGTYSISDGQAPRLQVAQDPCVVADEYYGEPGTSSIRRPNDLAIFKPNSDILVTGTATTREREPLRRWVASVQVGSLTTKVELSGERTWNRNAFGFWSLGEPAPTNEVPLRYERSVGGQWNEPDDAGVDELNPIGCGWVSKAMKRGDGPIAAPQITAVGTVPTLGDSATPAGLGPIAPSWIQRRQYAGTYDEEWLANRAPKWPSDFKFDFFNAAHPSMVYPGYLRGGEEVVLGGLTSSGQLTFSLPSIRITAIAEDVSNYRRGAIGLLDTVHLDLDESRLWMVWRVAVPLVGGDLTHLTLNMDPPPNRKRG